MSRQHQGKKVAANSHGTNEYIPADTRISVTLVYNFTRLPVIFVCLLFHRHRVPHPLSHRSHSDRVCRLGVVYLFHFDTGSSTFPANASLSDDFSTSRFTGIMSDHEFGGTLFWSCCSLSCLPLHAPSSGMHILTPSQPVDITTMRCVTVVEANTESLLHLL